MDKQKIKPISLDVTISVGEKIVSNVSIDPSSTSALKITLDKFIEASGMDIRENKMPNSLTF